MEAEGEEGAQKPGTVAAFLHFEELMVVVRKEERMVRIGGSEGNGGPVVHRVIPASGEKKHLRTQCMQFRQVQGGRRDLSGLAEFYQGFSKVIGILQIRVEDAGLQALPGAGGIEEFKLPNAHRNALRGIEEAGDLRNLIRLLRLLETTIIARSQGADQGGALDGEPLFRDKEVLALQRHDEGRAPGGIAF